MYTIISHNKGGVMRRFFFTLLGIFGAMMMLTAEVSAGTVLSKISTMVIIFTSIAGGAIWIYALKKRKDLDE